MHAAAAYAAASGAAAATASRSTAPLNGQRPACAWSSQRIKNKVLACARRYGGEHKAPELQKEAVYGLTELHREAVK